MMRSAVGAVCIFARTDFELTGFFLDAVLELAFDVWPVVETEVELCEVLESCDAVDPVVFELDDVVPCVAGFLAVVWAKLEAHTSPKLPASNSAPAAQ